MKISTPDMLLMQGPSSSNIWMESPVESLIGSKIEGEIECTISGTQIQSRDEYDQLIVVDRLACIAENPSAWLLLDSRLLD
jgi:hypothetical protein